MKSKQSIQALLCALTFAFGSIALAQNQLTPAQKAEIIKQVQAEVERRIADLRNWQHSEEGLAYIRLSGSPKDTANKKHYMDKLSPGGKIYFLACRQDFAEALKLLDKFPKHDTGSALYLRAKCLDGQHKRLDAIAMYSKARAKIGKGFNPGFRFFLHSASAQAAVGHDVDAMRDLKTAIEKGADTEKNPTSKAAVAQSVIKRAAYMEEKQGKFKSAFENYLKLFGESQSQFHLDEPIEVDGSVKSRAGKWLKEHPSPPSTKDQVEVCKYLTTKAKAYLAVGDEQTAKETLLRAVELQEPLNGNLPTEHYDNPYSPLGKARDVASSLLIRLDIRDKDYKSACKHIRATFVIDPARDDQKQFSCISMNDVPELVTQHDRDLHSYTAEEWLDHGLSGATTAGPRGTKKH